MVEVQLKIKMSTSATEQASNFQIRPELKDKFRSNVVKDVIHSVLVEHLAGFVYSAEGGDQMACNIADTVRAKVVELKLPQYKFVVDVTLGEQRGEGVKVGAKCLWDSDADNYASDVFLAETFFCSATVFAIFFY